MNGERYLLDTNAVVALFAEFLDRASVVNLTGDATELINQIVQIRRRVFMAVREILSNITRKTRSQSAPEQAEQSGAEFDETLRGNGQ